MTWVVWRQHRLEGLITLGVLVLLGVFLVWTGLEMASSFQQLGLSKCLGQISKGSIGSMCNELLPEFEGQTADPLGITPLLITLPLLLGALVGAPLVAREVEQHTQLLAWTQSITRLRWLTVKLALVLGTGLLAAGALLSLMIWWRSPSAQIDGSFGNGAAYDTSGPVWLGATLLALALGVCAGALTRRVVAAIFLTIPLFVAICAPVEVWLRPNFEPPLTVTWPFAQPAPPGTLSKQNWQIDAGFLDAHGNKTDTPLTCTLKPLKKGTAMQCLPVRGVKNYLTYQPANRFWTFQWIETGIYVGFSVLALFAAFWLTRRLN